MPAGVLARVAAADASRAPWLVPYRPAAQQLLAQFGPGVSLARALNATLAGLPPIQLDAGALRFVEPDALPTSEAYESHIARTGCVPVRDDAHDLFNALVWLTHPRLKAQLNRLHARALATPPAAGRRGALRDAVTVFDENGAVLHAPAALVQALRERDWDALFGTRRALWRQATLRLVGHALLEKLLQPRKAITAHVWVADGAGSRDALADTFTPQRLEAKPFLALPVLGVPGWWPANEDTGFYADPQVFRPPRR